MSKNERDFNRDAATWDENPVRLKLAQDLGKAIKQEVALHSEMTALDFACGTGLVTLEIQPMVQSVTGMDSSAGMLGVLAQKAKARGLHNLELVHIEQNSPVIPLKSFDLILMTMALHHVETPEPLLKQFFDGLKPGGVLCIADLDKEDGSFHEDQTGVFHNGFERGTLCQWLQAVGFSEVKVQTATEVAKPVSQGILRAFPVFLVIARKI